jgi:GNAT superfamily N-acetyltransferase
MSMTSVVSIRQVSLDDVETPVDLRLALERASGHLTQDAMVADVRRATRRYFLEALPANAIVVWVAEAQGTIVATSGLIFFQKPPSERNLTGLEAYILNMYTVPAWRGQGIATRLLQTLIAFAKQRQAQRIWMYATQDGRPLYERAGFVPKRRHTLEMELIW